MQGGSYKSFVEQKLRKFLDFVIFAILEWIVIFLLFINGLISFISNEFAKFFDLRIPCLLCTRIDHVLVHRNSNFYYNDSICEDHKKNISSLAYCHVHKKLSDIRDMCDGCLFSFATEKDSDCDKYKSFVGIYNKDIDLFIEDDKKLLMKPLMKDDNIGDPIPRCSCCGEPLKLKSSLKYKRNLSMSAPAPSPRALPLLQLSQDIQGRDNVKDVAMRLLQDSEDINQSPRFVRGNRFFGIPLSDSPKASPRWGSMVNNKKLSIDKVDFILDPNDITSSNEVDNDTLNRLKKQVRVDSKSLMELYMELDEERNASAIAANNTMAMITRLQAEKAALQMEALQYQRMMDEQAEYDQEALEEMNDLLFRRGEEMKVLESELENYREKYGVIKKVGSEICEVDGDEDYQEMKSRSFSSFSEKSDCGSLNGVDEPLYKRSMEYGGVEASFDFEGERFFLLGLLNDIEKKMVSSSDEGSTLSYTINNEEEYTGNENKVSLAKEVSSIKERLRAVEAESGFLKHAAMTLQRGGGGDEGTKLLNEIALHLCKLRPSVNSPTEHTDG